MADKLNLLTDADCRNASSGGKKLVKLHDGGGLYLWVYDDGTKYWRLRYWLSGKEKSLSLGVYGKGRVSLKDARKKRDEERKRLDAGLDPSAERQAEKIRKGQAAENSFEAVAREWYGKQLHTWVPGPRDRREAAPGNEPLSFDRTQAHRRNRSARTPARRAQDRGTRRLRPRPPRAAGERSSLPLRHRHGALHSAITPPICAAH